MKKSLFAIAALVALVSCQSLKEEWQPVLSNPKAPAPSLISDFDAENIISIKDLKAMYKDKAVEIMDNVWIKGQVISSDRSGNLYKEIYIQDGTGAIDLKLGRSSLYSEFSLGQWVYVDCNGLTLGSYKGMPQLGLEADQTEGNEYETAYIDPQVVIDQHVFKGPKAEPLKPQVITEAQVKTSLGLVFQGELWGKLVTLEGLVYKKEVFCLLYPHALLPHTKDDPYNRIFLSDNGTWGINTWAMSKGLYTEFVKAGLFDNAEVGSGSTRYGNILGTPRQYLKTGATLDRFGADADLTYKEIMLKYPQANYVSHYFKFGKTDIQVRTSGYAKFSDQKLPQAVTSAMPVSVTGILTIYDGSAQITLLDDPSESVL